ncbi:glycosyltransferase WbuB [Pandoraea terrae]|uniref:Glycosyltransferase WbuB n=1 Tax=Pandoraea terrae TaxID=1537710 RepID=A0A5E4UV15_9BURK|nr:glycosyltransferase WbuB [Pandoraea terrae]VVE02310.1 glycosyltransferase WbuB [Pandoraea terrae]
MKILIYGLNYAPELTGIGKYSTEMSEYLAARGHEVRAVCAPPYYPAWRVSPGYASWRYVKEHRAGVTLWRAPLWVPSAPTGLTRLLHLASFALSSLPLLVRQLAWRPDVVFCVAPSLANAPAGWLTARMTGARAWLHIQDFEVDAAFGLGLLKGGAMRGAVRWLERAVLRRFDVVSTISEKMMGHALRKGVSPVRLAHFPNWVDTNDIAPLDTVSVYRGQLGIPADHCVVLYAGNMGAKQGLEVLAAAALALQGRGNMTFVFCGDGSWRAALEHACSGLPNCRFLPLQPSDRLNALLNLADIHVLPQRADAADLVMPSKLTGMFASARAVVAMAARGTELHDVVSARGVVVPPGDVRALTRAISALADDPQRRQHLGAAAREYALAVLSREAVLARFEADLNARTGLPKPHRCAERPEQYEAQTGETDRR